MRWRAIEAVEKDAHKLAPPQTRGAEWPPAPPQSRTRAFLAGLVAVLVLITLGAYVRIDTALRDPNFDRVHAQGMLKSDPALLYYFTERILESGGLPPADFRADPRVEYPLTTDIPAMFPVGQEFVIAWCYRWFGGGMPLHVFCVWVMGIIAALCAVGVYGLAFELTRRVRWAIFAAALYGILPANYRTIGFILVGEDFSLPWFCLHLWLLARAARVRTRTAVLLAALPLGIALSTWHATSFLVTLEAACFFAWFLRAGENPFTRGGAWILPAVLSVFALTVPVLRSTLFLLSLPMQWMLGMLGAEWLRRTRGVGPGVERMAACGFAVVALIVALWISTAIGGGLGEYSHVFGLLWQKVLHLGQLPADPRELPFEVRLMWQGPFDTLDIAQGIQQLGWATVFIAPALLWAWRDWRLPERPLAPGSPRGLTLLCTLLAVALPVAWLIERTILLPGILLPVVGACVLGRMAKPTPALACGILALALQGFFFERFRSQHEISWYRPPQRQVEIAELVQHIPELVPAGEPIAADFMNSTAILAHTRHPIVLQPKYEFRRSRERAERFLRTFFEGTPEELRRLLLDEFHCRYLLVDRFTLGFLSRYAAGFPRGHSELRPGSAASIFLSQEAAVLESVPGFHLLYRSPGRIAQRDGSATDFFRLYELGL